MAMRSVQEEERLVSNLISLDDFNHTMEKDGWLIFPEFVSLDLVERMRADLQTDYERCRDIQINNDIPDNNEMTVHHLIGQGGSWMEFLEIMEPLVPYYESYFHGKFILNSFGGAINTKDSRNYSHNIHRDIRSFSGDMPLLLNTLVMLDDFTEENGATWMLTGGHRMAEKPSEEYFFAHSDRALGKAGSVLVFNSNMWHAGGDNTVGEVRRSVTPMFCKPYIKQQFDYPRALGYDRMDSFSDYMQQVIGYKARVPASLDEWYQPSEKRMYRPDQG